MTASRETLTVSTTASLSERKRNQGAPCVCERKAVLEKRKLKRRCERKRPLVSRRRHAAQQHAAHLRYRYNFLCLRPESGSPDYFMPHRAGSRLCCRCGGAASGAAFEAAYHRAFNPSWLLTSGFAVRFPHDASDGQKKTKFQYPRHRARRASLPQPARRHSVRGGPPPSITSYS